MLKLHLILYNSDNTDNDVFDDEADYLHISEDSPDEHRSKTRIIQGRTVKKPRFVKIFEETSVKEGNELLLTCHVEGHPKPDVTWYTSFLNFLKFFN